VKDSLRPGLSHELTYVVPESKTVPFLFPEATSFASMPKVLATGFMVGLFEWACVELVAPHLEDGEGTLGIHVDFSHTAATPPGFTVTVNALCTNVTGRKLEFEVFGHDGVDEIGRGLHRRAVIRFSQFEERMIGKRR
jgi:fluoroacetyl-CoA thioesterase